MFFNNLISVSWIKTAYKIRPSYHKIGGISSADAVVNGEKGRNVEGSGGTQSESDG